MIVLIFICIILGAYYLWNQKYESSDEPPATPGGWPLVGQAPLLIGDSCHLWRAVTDLANKSYNLGGVVSCTIGPRTTYAITDPDDALTVANACLQKDKFYAFAKPWLGEGLVTGDLPIWKVHRKLLQPAFSQIVLDGFIGVFNSQSRKLVKDLEVEVGKGPFDHWIYTRHNALETICLTALGVDFTDQNLNSQYVEAAEVVFYTIVDRFQKFWLHSNWTFMFSGVKKKQDEHLKILHNMSDTVLQRRKSEMNCKIRVDYNNNEKFPGGKIKFKPFLDLLLELSMEHGVFTDKEIREHVDTMIVGGHDTSANVLMFTLLLLGSHMDVQDKVFDELDAVFESSDRDVEKYDLPKLTYLEAVLKESMRIHSIVPVTARWLDKDVKLKNCTLTSGRTCFILVQGIHRHPGIWGPDADEFKPDRWLDPSTLPDSPNAIASFMIGRRTCIGKNYAFMSMKTTLAHLLRRYRVKSDDSELELKLEVMLKPASGYYISIEERNSSLQK